MSGGGRRALGARALDALFRDARTHSNWTERQPPGALLRRIVELASLGPTSANTSPARYVFIRSAAGKARLAPALAEGNLAKTMAAPVTVIVAYDLEFFTRLPHLFPHRPAAADAYARDERHAHETAFRNGSLQGAYFILAARSLGLDCGPMSGFDAGKIDAEFFAASALRTNFLCNLGYGEAAAVRPRLPRLPFDEVARFA